MESFVVFIKIAGFGVGFFFFSSRRRHTRSLRDWSSDVCSSDLFAPDASEILRLAVRCQHIQRWTIARSEYAMDRIGYLQWRKRLYKFHAQTAGDILRDAGYDEATIERVGTLLKKEGIKSDADVQTLEDVVDLVFLESYLADFVARHGQYDLAKFTDILAKTAKKMSTRGRESAVTLIDAPADLAPLIRSVMQAVE